MVTLCMRFKNNKRVFFAVMTFFICNISFSTLSAQEKEITIVQNPVSFGYDKKHTRKEADIDTVIIHSTHSIGKDKFSFKGVLSLYKRYHVAPHYVINRLGIVHALVPLDRIAFHAGFGIIKGDTESKKKINERSIGIEIINSKDIGPNDLQYQSLQRLLSLIKKEHAITYVLGHSDVDPDRKTDPWKFDWEKIKKEGAKDKK